MTDPDILERLAAEGHRSDDHLTDEEVAKEARGNHVWLNAFGCINPTDEFLREVGLHVLRALNETDIRDGFVGRSPVTYMRFNRS